MPANGGTPQATTATRTARRTAAAAPAAPSAAARTHGLHTEEVDTTKHMQKNDGRSFGMCDAALAGIVLSFRVMTRTGCSSERERSLTHEGRWSDTVCHACTLTQLPPKSEATKRQRDSLPSMFCFVTFLGSELSIVSVARPCKNRPPTVRQRHD